MQYKIASTLFYPRQARFQPNRHQDKYSYKSLVNWTFWLVQIYFAEWVSEPVGVYVHACFPPLPFHPATATQLCGAPGKHPLEHSPLTQTYLELCLPACPLSPPRDPPLWRLHAWSSTPTDEHMRDKATDLWYDGSRRTPAALPDRTFISLALCRGVARGRMTAVSLLLAAGGADNWNRCRDTSGGDEDACQTVWERRRHGTPAHIAAAAADLRRLLQSLVSPETPGRHYGLLRGSVPALGEMRTRRKIKACVALRRFTLCVPNIAEVGNSTAEAHVY